MEIKIGDCFIVPPHNNIVKVVSIIDGLDDLGFSAEEKEKMYALIGREPCIMFDNGWNLDRSRVITAVKTLGLIKTNNLELAKAIYD